MQFTMDSLSLSLSLFLFVIIEPLKQRFPISLCVVHIHNWYPHAILWLNHIYIYIYIYTVNVPPYWIWGPISNIVELPLQCCCCCCCCHHHLVLLLSLQLLVGSSSFVCLVLVLVCGLIWLVVGDSDLGRVIGHVVVYITVHVFTVVVTITDDSNADVGGRCCFINEVDVDMATVVV